MPELQEQLFEGCFLGAKPRAWLEGSERNGAAEDGRVIVIVVVDMGAAGGGKRLCVHGVDQGRQVVCMCKGADVCD